MKEKEARRKPSEEQPWMKYYPDAVKHLQIPECTLKEYLESNCVSRENIAMHYYGTDVTWKEVFEQTEFAARALRAAGFKEGDQIPVFLRAVPEFISLLLGAEAIGASLLCRDNTIEENVEAVRKSGSTTIITHDFLSYEECQAYINGANVEHIVMLSPYHSAKRNMMPQHIENYIDSHYQGKRPDCDEIMSWDKFIENGIQYTGETTTEKNPRRPLFRAYTSGSTGPSKQVIHSAHTMIGIIHQMSIYGASSEFRPTWLLTQLPPCLVAVVVSMILSPMTSNKLLILDPFCDVRDLDLELMRYRPNCWPIIPMFMELIMQSDRIPKDYDMSHLYAVGAGSEAFNNGQIRRAQAYLKEHNCNAVFTTGYGQSEAGSNCTLPCMAYPMGDGNIGIPMPMTVLGIFEPGTQNELGYNQLGEICKSGPGNMLGYDNREATEKALQLHKDGKEWLHTGDIGYMNEDGVVYVLTRGDSRRFGGGRLIALTMENKIVDAGIEGIEDEFFVIAPDKEHAGYFVPYLYVVLQEGYTTEDVEEAVMDVLEEHEKPVRICLLPKRPFFHFKTNRIGLLKQLQAENSIA